MFTNHRLCRFVLQWSDDDDLLPKSSDVISGIDGVQLLFFEPSEEYIRSLFIGSSARTASLFVFCFCAWDSESIEFALMMR